MTFETIAISKIEVGDRRREDYGDIEKLARGIEKVGLLHPLIVQRENGHFRLVAGGRRLKALQSLGWPEAPARLFETLTAGELRDIELEENDNRKDFTEKERGRTFKAAKKVVDDAKKAKTVLAQTGPKPSGVKGGRPKEAASTRSVADAIGETRQSVERAEQQVDLAEKFPFMQGPDWRQSHVLAVGEALEHIPEEEHPGVVSVLGCAKILDPASAVELVGNIAAKKPEERSELYGLSASEDPRDKSRALSSAANKPPLADPRLNCIETAASALRRATKDYPKDPLTPQIKTVISELGRIRKAVAEVSYDARREAKGVGSVQ